MLHRNMKLLGCIISIVATPSKAWIETIKRVGQPIWNIIGNLVSVILGTGVIGFLIRLLKRRKKLQETMKSELDTNCAENMINRLFQIRQDKGKIFFREMVISHVENDKLHDWNDDVPIKTSCLITGEAGCGKSVLMNNMAQKILHCYHTILPFQSAFWYYNADKLLAIMNDNDNSLTETIEKSIISHPFLFIDGLDEIGDENYDQFETFIKKLKQQIPRIKICISCRSEFEERQGVYAFMYTIDPSVDRLQVNPWSAETLKKFSEYVLEKICLDEKKTVYIREKCKEWLEKSVICSPLVLVMCMGILSNAETDVFDDNSVITQKYRFYTQFMLHLPRHARYHYLDEKVLDGISKQVFEAYSHGKKRMEINEDASCIYKAPISIDKKAEFIHETIFEYFVARNYMNQFSSILDMEQMISALVGNYPNSYADFISAGINSLKKEEQSALFYRYASVYYCVTDEYTAKELTSWLDEKRNSNWQFDKNERIKWQNYIRGKGNVRNTNRQNAMQYEILFRLGRLDESVNREERIVFLEKIYHILDDKLQKETDNKVRRSIVISMRVCAISSSFLGGEKIEMDYVKRMLDDKKDNLFDEVNRAHTLLFYGDIKKGNIYEIKDSDNVQWANARRKRIDRLRVPLKENIEDMDAGMRRKVYFRLFDVATIYTFLRSRPRTELTNDEKAVLNTINVRPGNRAGERAEMIECIVERIKERISGENNSIS